MDKDTPTTVNARAVVEIRKYQAAYPSELRSPLYRMWEESLLRAQSLSQVRRLVTMAPKRTPR